MPDLSREDALRRIHARLPDGSERGGERAVTIYALIVTAKLNVIDPQAQLADLLARIADHRASKFDGLAPWNGSRSIRWPKPPEPRLSPDAY